MSRHSGILIGANHIVHNFEYADAAALAAAVGFVVTDVGKIARQIDDDSYHMLKDHDPIVWSAFVFAGDTHTLGGVSHAADTLANINAKVSDATLIDTADSRLSDSRSPTTHNTSHESGGGDAIKIDDLSAADDNTDLDASTSKHGLLLKLGGGSTNFLRADGTWAAPGGGSSFPTYSFFADQFVTPTTTGWDIDPPAVLDTDSIINQIKVLRFDDTTDEGAGLPVLIPIGATNIIFDFVSRPISSAASNLNVVLRVSSKTFGDNVAPSGWVRTTLSTLVMGTSNVYDQYDTQTVAISTLSMTAGRWCMLEISRYPTGGVDNLVDDWLLQLMNVRFS